MDLNFNCRYDESSRISASNLNAFEFNLGILIFYRRNATQPDRTPTKWFNENWTNTIVQIKFVVNLSWEFCDASFMSHVIPSPSFVSSCAHGAHVEARLCPRLSECAVCERWAHNLIWFVVRGKSASARARLPGHNGINRMATYHNGKNFSLSSVYVYIYVTSTRCVIFLFYYSIPLRHFQITFLHPNIRLKEELCTYVRLRENEKARN